MKRFIIAAALAASLSGAYAQGTITFNNGATTLITWGTQGLPAGATAGSSITADFGIKVGLFYNSSGSTFTLVSPTPYLGTLSSGTTNNAVAGRFNGGTVTVTGLTAGQSGSFQVRAWSSAYASYDAAKTAGGLTGASATFTNPSGGAVDPGTGTTSPAAGLTGFTSGFAVSGGAVVPEPSTVALAGLGLGALLLIRRRK